MLTTQYKLLQKYVTKSKPLHLFAVGVFFAISSAHAFATNRLAFRWDDVNTRSVIRWEGDTAVVREGGTMQSLSCKVRIKPRDIERAVREFGIPTEWTIINYRDERELFAKQRTLEEQASTRGIKMLDNNRFIVDYLWVIDRSVRELRDVARSIRREAVDQGYTSQREIVGAFVSFVQSLEYSIPPDRRIDDDGNEILTGGAMMPIDTLVKGWGDCDSKCLLFASLTQSIGLVDVCFIMLEDHLFAGVRLSPQPGEYSLQHRGRDWVLVELCDAWPMGRIPSEHYNLVLNGEYEIVDLD